MAANKLLSADTLFALIRAGFEQVPDQRAENASISLPDALMSGFAMFSLKDPLRIQSQSGYPFPSSIVYGSNDDSVSKNAKPRRYSRPRYCYSPLQEYSLASFGRIRMPICSPVFCTPGPPALVESPRLGLCAVRRAGKQPQNGNCCDELYTFE